MLRFRYNFNRGNTNYKKRQELGVTELAQADQVRQSGAKLIQHKDVWGSCLHSVRQCYTSSDKESKVPFARLIRQYIKRVRKLERGVVLSEGGRERGTERQWSVIYMCNDC